MIRFHEWKHVFKLDPDKSISDQALEAICESGTDALIVGGTSGVTFEKTIDLLGRIRRFETPCILEVSNPDAIVPGFDHYFIPVVMNATDPNWLLKPHREAVKQFGSMIPWQDVSTVGYCVLNADSAVARLTGSETRLSAEDVLAYARMAVHMFRFPFFYVEYSGMYGDPVLIGRVFDRLQTENDIHVFYGGGIRDRRQAQEMINHADTIVVGNVIYEDLASALQTVQIDKNASGGKGDD